VTYALDAGPMIAFLDDEPGADVVEEPITPTSTLSFPLPTVRFGSFANSSSHTFTPPRRPVAACASEAM
jgi:hypothetical protein